MRKISGVYAEVYAAAAGVYAEVYAGGSCGGLCGGSPLRKSFGRIFFRPKKFSVEIFFNRKKTKKTSAKKNSATVSHRINLQHKPLHKPQRRPHKPPHKLQKFSINDINHSNLVKTVLKVTKCLPI